jgi:hypothetical protein
MQLKSEALLLSLMVLIGIAVWAYVSRYEPMREGTMAVLDHWTGQVIVHYSLSPNIPPEAH